MRQARISRYLLGRKKISSSLHTALFGRIEKFKKKIGFGMWFFFGLGGKGRNIFYMPYQDIKNKIKKRVAGICM